jgi:hypothetical protein
MYIARNLEFFIQFSQRRWLHEFLNCWDFEDGIDTIFRNVSSQLPTDAT